MKEYYPDFPGAELSISTLGKRPPSPRSCGCWLPLRGICIRRVWLNEIVKAYNANVPHGVKYHKGNSGCASSVSSAHLSRPASSHVPLHAFMQPRVPGVPRPFSKTLTILVPDIWITPRTKLHALHAAFAKYASTISLFWVASACPRWESLSLKFRRDSSVLGAPQISPRLSGRQ